MAEPKKTTKRRMRAKSNFKERRDKRPNRKASAVASVPAKVRDFFQASVGDELVFVEGSAFEAERAALRPCGYLIVTVERAPKPAESISQVGGGNDLSSSSAGLSLEEEVRRRLDGR